jgi:hypothetical protein
VITIRAAAATIRTRPAAWSGRSCWSGACAPVDRFAVVVAVGLAGAVVGVVFWRGIVVVTRATDVTFVDAQHGWALTTHRCGGWHRCLRILRAADDGRSWQSVGVPPGAKAPLESLPCSHVINRDRPCIEHLTFADARTGYAWSDRLLYLTRDGGQSWSRRNGGADSLAGTIAPFEQLRANRGGAANVVKAALVQRGVIATDTVRPPVSGLTDDESLALSQIMAALAAYVEQSR